jgi:hypothetical protein
MSNHKSSEQKLTLAQFLLDQQAKNRLLWEQYDEETPKKLCWLLSAHKKDLKTASNSNSR